MDAQELLQILRDYREELNGILSRFERGYRSISIKQEDDPRFREIVIELRDLLNDAFGANSYSRMIISRFSEGIANFTQTPSYKSVENIRGIVSTVVTRVERDPFVVFRELQPSATGNEGAEENDAGVVSREVEMPGKITLPWLMKYVPVKLWIAFASILGGAFVAGIQASRLSIVKEIFRLSP